MIRFPQASIAIGLSTSSPFCNSAVLAMCGMKSTSRPSSGVMIFQVRMRPVGSPNIRSGNVSTILLAKGDIAVRRALAIQVSGPDTLSRSGRLPYSTLPCSHEFHEQFEFGSVDRFCASVGPCDRRQRLWAGQ